MASPLLSTHVDADFITFINEFLFNSPLPPIPSARCILRHQRTPPRLKRYRTMWRAAATSLMKKRYSSQETHLPFADHFLPAQRSTDNGNSSKEIHLPVGDHLPRDLLYQASSHNGHASQTTHLASAEQIQRDLFSQLPHNNIEGSLQNLPLEVSFDEGHPCQANHSSPSDPFLKDLPSQVFPDDGHSPQATDSLSRDQLLTYLPSQCSLDRDNGLDTINSQRLEHIRMDIDALKEATFITPAYSKQKIKGSQSGCCSKAQPLEATSTSFIPKHSSRKPPRPPRANVSRSTSYRAIRLKNAARRAMMDNARMRKQKSPKSNSNATSMLALIITLCFACIMLVQGFLGTNSKSLDSKAEGQRVDEGVSLLSLYTGIPPFTSESREQTFVAKHDADRTTLDQLQHKKQTESPFTSLWRYQLR